MMEIVPLSLYTKDSVSHFQINLRKFSGRQVDSDYYFLAIA